MALQFAYPLLLLAFPASVLLMGIFRLLRARRVSVEVGSLLLWRRISALNLAPQKKKFNVDRALLLQCAAALALSSALAGPRAHSSPRPRRELLLVIDNGPLSRARNNGAPRIDALLARAQAALRDLKPEDRVIVARSAPFPALLNSVAAGPEAASTLLRSMSPALSGPDAAALQAFALDQARALTTGAPMPVRIFSAEEDSLGSQALSNVGIVAAGSARNEKRGAGGRRILVRVQNFSASRVTGEVWLEASGAVLEKRVVELSANASAAVGFEIPADTAPSSALRVSWHNADGQPDALPEDDAVIFFPRATRAPRIRLHAPSVVLETFFRSALGAEILPENSALESDLAIYARSFPETIPADARAVLLLSPAQGYHSFFEIGAATLHAPKAERGDADPLNAGLPLGDARIVISSAEEIMRTGDFKVLLREPASGRPLAIQFEDASARPFFVFAFTPNAGLAPERKLDPALAALLARIVSAPAGSAPYALVKAGDVEKSSGSALPLDWRADARSVQEISGVLDEKVSNLLALGAHATPAFERSDSAPEPLAEPPYDLLPALAALAAALALLELFLRRRHVA